MSNEEREYYIKHFCNLVLLNSNEFGSSQTNSVKSKMNLSESEKKVYKEIAYDVYRLLRQNQFIIEYNKLGYEFSITQLGREERKKIMTAKVHKPNHIPNATHKISNKIAGFFLDRTFIITIFASLIILGLTIILHKYHYL